MEDCILFCFKVSLFTSLVQYGLGCLFSPYIALFVVVYWIYPATFFLNSDTKYTIMMSYHLLTMAIYWTLTFMVTSI